MLVQAGVGPGRRRLMVVLLNHVENTGEWPRSTLLTTIHTLTGQKKCPIGIMHLTL
jgi:hypothetical protein